MIDFQIKRFLICYRSLNTFAHHFELEPKVTLQRYRIDLSPKQGKTLLKFVDLLFGPPSQSIPPRTPKIVSDFLEYKKESMKIDSETEVQVLEQPMQIWRERQLNRNRMEMGYPSNHIPYCFELSKGCSVGCWFCAVSSVSFESNFLYTSANAKLWREILHYLKDLLGIQAARRLICYHATEPLDNPDYEKFLKDAFEILKTWPHTTTARAMKNPERTQQLLQMSKKNNGGRQRFSVLTPKILSELMTFFSADELADVEFLVQFGKDSKKKISGRAREQFQSKKGRKSQAFFPEEFASIGCASGFLINMVDKKIILTSPCNASEKCPTGEVIFGEESFEDIGDFSLKISEMISRYMHNSVKELPFIRLCPRLNIDISAKKLSIQSRWRKVCSEAFDSPEQLAQLIKQGTLTARQIAEARLDAHGIFPLQTYEDLQTLFQAGVLDESPPESRASCSNAKPKKSIATASLVTS